MKFGDTGQSAFLFHLLLSKPASTCKTAASLLVVGIGGVIHVEGDV